jgi:hypothetical protein
VLSVLALPVGLRALAAFALALLLGQYVLPAVHYAAEEHEVCPEHGELVHVRGSHTSEPPAGEGPGISGAGERDDHGHCDVVPAVSREGQALAARAELEVAPPAAEKTAAAIVARAQASKTPLFRLAPKQSPPL